MAITFWTKQYINVDILPCLLVNAMCLCVLRGIKVKSTLGFLEVVVGCSIVEPESSVESSHSGAEQKTIHLHLKKFFSGTRFSSQYFLNCMAAKHKEGNLVYVSGKVGELKYCYLLHATCYPFLVVPPNHEACMRDGLLLILFGNVTAQSDQQP